MAFIQIIKFRTSKIDEMRALGEEHQQKRGDGGPDRVLVCANRDNPGEYLNMVFFDSYEEAMANSEHPATQELSAKMSELGEGPPTFYNLDVIDDRTPSRPA